MQNNLNKEQAKEERKAVAIWILFFIVLPFVVITIMYIKDGTFDRTFEEIRHEQEQDRILEENWLCMQDSRKCK